MLSSASLGEALSKAVGAYTICYPTRDDTLWSVAKRYHRALEEVVQKNHLSEATMADAAESLAGIRYLLV